MKCYYEIKMSCRIMQLNGSMQMMVKCYISIKSHCNAKSHIHHVRHLIKLTYEKKYFKTNCYNNNYIYS